MVYLAFTAGACSMNFKVALLVGGVVLLNAVTVIFIASHVLDPCDEQVVRIASPDGARTLVRTRTSCMLAPITDHFVLETADEWEIERRFTLPPFSYAWKDADSLSACWPSGQSPTEGELAQLAWWPVRIEFIGACP
jgi:hypothetical protein